MAYKPQFYPGSTSVGINRRKHMSGNLEKLRDIPEADVTAIMGHRAPGADYSSTHPPLKEMGEPDCPVRQLAAPTAGAAAGDRVRYSQWTDSMYFAPSIPYWRSYWGAINCKGIDPGTLSGRQIIEARERDIEAYTKAQYDSEMTDVALCSMRGCTVHGHSRDWKRTACSSICWPEPRWARTEMSMQPRTRSAFPWIRRSTLASP